MAETVSAIIPIAPGETEWQNLVPSLQLSAGSEILLACGEQSLDLSKIKPAKEVSVQQISSSPGRAQQMNAGAAKASNAWLWFLHADSQLGEETLGALQKTTSTGQQALYFFDLKFSHDGPRQMRLNELAVRWRAGHLKMPFGDQGFLIPKLLFEALGKYRTDLAYGEDHVFVWKTRQEGYPVLRAGAPLVTSARKYAEHGWLATTLKFVWLTILQGVPQRIILLKRQIGRLIS